MSRRTAGICLIAFALLLYALDVALPERPRTPGSTWSPHVEPLLIIVVALVGIGYLVAAERGERRRPPAP